MDREKFIEEAKKMDYTDEMIAKEIQHHEELLKKGIDLDPTLFLFKYSWVPCGPRNRDSDE